MHWCLLACSLVCLFGGYLLGLGFDIDIDNIALVFGGRSWCQRRVDNSVEGGRELQIVTELVGLGNLRYVLEDLDLPVGSGNTLETVGIDGGLAGLDNGFLDSESPDLRHGKRRDLSLAESGKVGLLGALLEDGPVEFLDELALDGGLEPVFIDGPLGVLGASDAGESFGFSHVLHAGSGEGLYGRDFFPSLGLGDQLGSGSEDGRRSRSLFGRSGAEGGSISKH
mmetsp:Transcript_24707/g.68205  ORF Transcript_24707/g.68205 Transcript_24707/m.68205 type:complete len:225 (+) Transcript_24707:66-740(+)